MNYSKPTAGFTLIELMIVIAILAILLAIAIPAYQNYSIRTSNSECLNLVTSVKLALVDTAHSSGSTVESVQLADVGMPAGTTNTEACSDFNVVDGVISISTTGAGGTSPGLFTIEPIQADINDSVAWTCTSDHANQQHVPAECRGS
jgi:type IV pilus assembly protein PilA